jgi:4'-phosphopantetheinyl transferase
MTLPSDITFRHLRFDPDHLESWEALLSAEERVRADGFLRGKRRQEFILGRAAARMLLSERMEVNPKNVVLEVAESGAIDVVDSELHISIAHSGDHAVAAAAPRYVGVDIETIAPRHVDLHRYMLHPNEYHLIDTLPLDRERAQILCWTLKEAVLKGMREGLRYSPKKLQLRIDMDRSAAAVETENGRNWNVFFEEWDAYYVAVAVEPD